MCLIIDPVQIALEKSFILFQTHVQHSLRQIRSLGTAGSGRTIRTALNITASICLSGWLNKCMVRTRKQMADQNRKQEVMILAAGS